MTGGREGQGLERGNGRGLEMVSDKGLASSGTLWHGEVNMANKTTPSCWQRGFRTDSS